VPGAAGGQRGCGQYDDRQKRSEKAMVARHAELLRCRTLKGVAAGGRTDVAAGQRPEPRASR
jgi:hypothetical protein